MFGGGNKEPEPEPKPKLEPKLEPKVEQEVEMIIEETQNRFQPVDAPIPPRGLDGIQYVNAAPVGEGLTDFTSLESNECQFQLPQQK